MEGARLPSESADLRLQRKKKSRGGREVAISIHMNEVKHADKYVHIQRERRTRTQVSTRRDRERGRGSYLWLHTCIHTDTHGPAYSWPKGKGQQQTERPVSTQSTYRGTEADQPRREERHATIPYQRPRSFASERGRTWRRRKTWTCRNPWGFFTSSKRKNKSYRRPDAKDSPETLQSDWPVGYECHSPGQVDIQLRNVDTSYQPDTPTPAYVFSAPVNSPFHENR